MSPVEQLRSDPEFTKRWVGITSNPDFQRGLAVLVAGREMEDADLGADALTSVRILARQRGYNAAISDIINLGRPLESEPTTRLPDFGTGLTPEELAEAYTNPA